LWASAIFRDWGQLLVEALGVKNIESGDKIQWEETGFENGKK